VDVCLPVGIVPSPQSVKYSSENMSARTSARTREIPAGSLREPEVKNPSGVVAEEETAPEMAAASSEPAQKGPATKGKKKAPAEKKEEKEEEEEEAASVVHRARGKPPSLALVLLPGVTLCTKAAASSMTAPVLKSTYESLFGVKCNSSNADWIRKKICKMPPVVPARAEGASGEKTLEQMSVPDLRELYVAKFNQGCKSNNTDWIRKKLREAGGDLNLAAVDVAAADGRKRKAAESPKVPKSPKIPIANGRKLRDRAVSEDDEMEEEEEEKEEHKPTKRLKALDASKKDAKKDDGAQQKAKGKAPMTLPDDEDTEEAKKPRGRPAKNPPPPPGSPAVAEETAKLETPKSAKNKGGRPRSVQKLKDADKAMKSEAGDSPGKRGRPSTLALEVQAGKSGCTAAEAKAMSAPELKAKYTDMFGVKCNSSNADWIRKKIAAAIS